MSKKIILVVCLLLCAALLSSCAGSPTENKRYDVVTNADNITSQNVLGLSSSQTVVTAPPAVEYIPPVEEIVYEEVEVTPVPIFTSEYAGATPVVIDPIDKPTPTPLPPLTFNYTTYDATKLHISFDAPSGWIINDISDDTYVIMNPDTNVDYQATLSVRVFSGNYSESQIKSEVSAVLSALKPNYYTFSSTKTASRTLLDKAGSYADFSATLSDGTALKGRVHIACVDKKVYVVQMTAPAGYYETYKDTVYAKFRNTIKITQ